MVPYGRKVTPGRQGESWQPCKEPPETGGQLLLTHSPLGAQPGPCEVKGAKLVCCSHSPLLPEGTVLREDALPLCALDHTEVVSS